MRRFSRELLISSDAGGTLHPLRALHAPSVRIAALSIVAALMAIGPALGAPPTPPRRPATLSAPPEGGAVPVRQSSPPPAQPAPSPAKPPDSAPTTPQRAPVDIDPEKLQPYNLPPASRQRMRLCGERWRDLKMAGKSAGLTWRSFAEKCLPGD